MAQSIDRTSTAASHALGWPRDLQKLYAASSQRFVGIASVLIGRRAEAEEIVHDAFVAVAASNANVDNLEGYLHRSVVNGCYGILRHRRTQEQHASDQPPADAPEHLIEFRDVLLKLPWKQRAVIVLRFLDDRSVKETAELLNMNESTVRSHCARGLRSLRKELS